MREYCNSDEADADILIGLKVFGAPEDDNLISGRPLRTRTLATPTTVTKIVFNVQKFICHRSVPGEHEHCSSKNLDPSQESPKNVIFPKTAQQFRLNFSCLWRQCAYKNPRIWYLQENNSPSSSGQIAKYQYSRR
jgi:hypothetical protein